MKHCILHFGMHKTGSSSIQDTLFHARRVGGAIYLSLGHANASGAVQALAQGRSSEGLQRRRGWPEERLAHKRQRAIRLLGHAAQGPGERFILSAEALSHLDVDELQTVVEQIGCHFDQVTAVGYIREPVGYMSSAFQQHVRAGHAQKCHPSEFYPHYRRSFEKFEQVLGPQGVQYWPFDPGCFPGGDVVRDFCSRLGIVVDAADLRRVNESLSAEAIRLLWIFRHHRGSAARGAAGVQLNRCLVERLAGLPGPSLKFAWSAIEPVLKAQEDDLSWMASRLPAGLPAARPGSDDPGAHFSGEPEDLLRCSPQAWQWLCAQVGLPPASMGPPPAPAQVAAVMAAWVQTLDADRARPAMPT